MDYGVISLLLASLMLLASILAGILSARVGAPLLLVFLLLGMLAGQDGPGGFAFDDVETAFLIGSVALAVILFDGGVRTDTATIRRAWGPSLVLATFGAVVTAGLVAAMVHYLLGIGWMAAWLIGSIVASTDAAAVFLLLGRSGINLRDRLRATLELESGSNDPMGIFLTATFVSLISVGAEYPDVGVALDFVWQMGVGGTMGLLGGYGLVWLMNRVILSGGLYPILALAAALLIFSATQLMEASGFLAVYVAGLVFGNRRVRASQVVGRFFDGLAWLSQIVMFVMLGLLVNPSELIETMVPTLIIAAGLIFVARPVAVFLSLTPFGFSLREQLFASWVGLRGAVPIFLALFPFMAGIDQGRIYFNLAFFVVLISLLLQGWSIPWVARVLGLALPPQPEAAPRLDVDLIRQIDRDLIAYNVKPHSRATDVPFGQLELPKRSRILSVIRGGVVQRLSEIERLEAGDFILALTPPEQAETLDRFFSRRFASTAAALDAEQGDFILDGAITLENLVQMYGIPISRQDPTQTLDALFHKKLGKRPGRGDRIRLGGVELVAVDIIGPEVKRVGVILEPAGFRARLLRRLGSAFGGT